MSSLYVNLNRISLKKLDEFVREINNKDISFFFFVETAFKEEKVPRGYNSLSEYFRVKLPDFTIFRADRETSNGGVAIFLKKKSYKTCKLLEIRDENIVIQIDEKLIILSYISCKQTKNEYMAKFSVLKELFEKYKQSEKNIIIGDLNERIEYFYRTSMQL